MKTLDSRVAVVTGAGSGIGQALAVELSRAGCNLALVDVRPDGLQETHASCSKTRVTLHEVDVSDAARMDALAAEVARLHGGAHILVNNAGVSVSASFMEHSLEDFEWLMSINFWGVVYGCRSFLPLLLEAEEGHIVNLSSVFGLVGVPMNSAYCCSKFAVRGLSECLRAELASTRVGVTSVHPGGVATNIVKRARVREPEDMRGMHERSVRAFEKMLPPSQAARRIVQGIRKNAARVLITREAHLIDGVKRAFPTLTGEFVGRHWRRLSERVLGSD